MLFYLLKIVYYRIKDDFKMWQVRAVEGKSVIVHPLGIPVSFLRSPENPIEFSQ